MSVLAPPPQGDELELLIREARERQRKRWSRAAAVAASAAVGLSVWAFVPDTKATSPSTPTVDARGAAIPACSSAQLRISLPRRFAGLGHLNGDLRFTNTSRVGCRLSGWPAVAAVQANGETVPAQRIPALWMAWALNWPRSRPTRPIILRRGDSAYAEIDGGDNPVGGATSCPSARWLRVAAPGAHSGVRLSAVWWSNPGKPVYYSLCGGIAVTGFFPRSALPR